jgi:hypothetical protein
MPRTKKPVEPLDDMPEVDGAHEHVAVIQSVKHGSPVRSVTKEFDLRAAHHAWKERHGIEDEW